MCNFKKRYIILFSKDNTTYNSLYLSHIKRKITGPNTIQAWNTQKKKKMRWIQKEVEGSPFLFRRRAPLQAHRGRKIYGHQHRQATYLPPSDRRNRFRYVFLIFFLDLGMKSIFLLSFFVGTGTSTFYLFIFKIWVCNVTFY